MTQLNQSVSMEKGQDCSVVIHKQPVCFESVITLLYGRQGEDPGADLLLDSSQKTDNKQK